MTHDGLASLNPLTGALDPYLSVQLTGHHNYTGLTGQSNAPVGERRMEVNATGTRCVVVLDFRTPTECFTTRS